MNYKPDKPDKDEGMTKEGVVRPGKTPSVRTGKPSQEIRRDKQAYASGEASVDSVESLADDIE